MKRTFSSAIIFYFIITSVFSQDKMLGFERFTSPEYTPGKGSSVLSFPNGDLKNLRNNWPVGWTVPDLNKISAAIALQGGKNGFPLPAQFAYSMEIPLGEYSYMMDRVKSGVFSPPFKDLSEDNSTVIVKTEPSEVCSPYFHLNGLKNAFLRSPNFDVIANKPHYISMWVRCKSSSATPNFTFWYDSGLEKINYLLSSLPITKGDWKRYGFYFRAISDVQKAHFTLFFKGTDDDFLDFGDVKLHQVSEAEFDEAYKLERNEIPTYSPKPSPNDGVYLANTIAKLQGKSGIPGKPFVIWGLGSSWTNGLGNLEALRQAIYRKFPNAPEIVYRKKVGSGSSYTNVLGWVQTQILIEQPDLIISYTNGNMESLEAMLKIIRSKTTADIILPTLHLTSFDKINKDNTIGLDYVDQTVVSTSNVEKMKVLCTNYKAQFVDNRKLLTDWLIENKKEPVSLLSDKVHQNRIGVTFTVENIAQHFVNSQKPGYDYNALEENISLVKAFKSKDKRFQFTGDWKVEGEHLVSTTKGAKIRLKCSGNRVVLVGKKTENGGSTSVEIDDVPSSKLKSFGIDFIKSAIANRDHNGNAYYNSSGGNSDASPHAVYLGENIIPQAWTIKMIDNSGNYQLTGSVTGADGKGSVNEVFKSKSGQITIDPALWRAKEKSGENDFWTFNVKRTAINTISFEKDENSNLFYTDIFTNLSNSEHTIEIDTANNGVVSIQSIYVCTPMLK